MMYQAPSRRLLLLLMLLLLSTSGCQTLDAGTGVADQVSAGSTYQPHKLLLLTQPQQVRPQSHPPKQLQPQRLPPTHQPLESSLQQLPNKSYEFAYRKDILQQHASLPQPQIGESQIHLQKQHEEQQQHSTLGFTKSQQHNETGLMSSQQLTSPRHNVPQQHNNAEVSNSLQLKDTELNAFKEHANESLSTLLKITNTEIPTSQQHNSAVRNPSQQQRSTTGLSNSKHHHSVARLNISLQHSTAGLSTSQQHHHKSSSMKMEERLVQIVRNNSDPQTSAYKKESKPSYNDYGIWPEPALEGMKQSHSPQSANGKIQSRLTALDNGETQLKPPVKNSMSQSLRPLTESKTFFHPPSTGRTAHFELPSTPNTGDKILPKASTVNEKVLLLRTPFAQMIRFQSTLSNNKSVSKPPVADGISGHYSASVTQKNTTNTFVINAGGNDGEMAAGVEMEILYEGVHRNTSAAGEVTSGQGNEKNDEVINSVDEGDYSEEDSDETVKEDTGEKSNAVGVNGTAQDLGLVSPFEQLQETAERLRDRLRRTSRDLGLTHYSRPGESAPQFRHTPIQKTVSPGSPVFLKCSAIGSPNPVITWTHDQRPLHNSLGSIVSSFRTALGEVMSHVNLSDVTARDGGLYTCTAHNALGSISHSARINVYGPPFVRAMPNVTSVSGDDVRLWCPAGGYPRPTITWRRDTQVLPISLRQELLTNGTLVLRNVGHEDAGRYSCVVSGLQSQTAVSHTYLHVLKPPVIEPVVVRKDLEEGERTQLTCMVKSGDLPITINWLKDGHYLQSDPDIDIKQLGEFSKVLMFKKLREHHSGSYTCEVANAAATVNVTEVVKIKVSPRWVIEPSSETALVGSTVVLDCSARGFPQPTITWMKAQGGGASRDFQPMVVDGVKSSRAPNGSLILVSVSPLDAGWFLCQADNSVGKPISKDIQLTVHAPARVVTEGGRITGHVGQTVSVTCEATGDEPLDLKWLRHHAPVTAGIRTSVREAGPNGVRKAVLEIRKVTASDAGRYTCRAKNPHGQHDQIFNIIVIEPPTAPAGVSVKDITSRSARVSWTLPQPAQVTVQYKASKQSSWANDGRNVSVGQWTTSHVLAGLTPYQQYAVRLMAHNDLGVSQPSNTVKFTTLEEVPTGTPRDVRVAATGPRSLVVTWRAPDSHLTHGPLRGYALALRQQSFQGDVDIITRPVTVSPGNSEAIERYEVRGLAPSSFYEVAVQAFTRAGPGPLSSPRIVAATNPQAPSCGPSEIQCRSSGRGGVRVWWSPPRPQCAQAPVTGYTIVATPTKHINQASEVRMWEVNTTNLEKNLAALPPASNISVRVKAFNGVGVSPPSEAIFCLTEDDVPGPPQQVRVVVTGITTLLASWAPPFPSTGTILHYTLYASKDDQPPVRSVVEAGGSEATWREVPNIPSSSRVQVWVTSTTSAGEGTSSPRLTASPSTTPKYLPVAVGGRRLWRVGVGTGVTLGCRGLGTPPPSISWTKGGTTITSNQFMQLLPGGDLHLTSVKETANYTCWVKNSEGTDSVNHYVIAVTTPTPPSLTLARALYDSLNLSIIASSDGGAPVLGYTVHHRGSAGEWVEFGVDPGVRSVLVGGLPCGAPRHLYLTAWNSQGSSTPSPVLIAETLGQPPGRPDPRRIVEVNETCVTLRLYAWPETGCSITHWKVEHGTKDLPVPWRTLHSHVTRDTADLGLCDLSLASSHLLRLTAASTAGDTSVVYRVATRDQSEDLISSDWVEEVVMSGTQDRTTWLDAHVVAGVVSAVLLATALIICVCVALRRKKYGGYRQGDSLDNKGGDEDNARNSEITRTHLYSPTPTKKPRGSLASLKAADQQTLDSFEICPYATFSVGSSEGTLEYGLSLHAMTPRDCLELPVHSERHVLEDPVYGHAGRQRSHTQYKETETAYISNSNRREYVSRPKSISGGQPPGTPNSVPLGRNAEEQEWPAEPRKDTGRAHRSRSRTGGSAQRDSSTESNDTSSPVQQRSHYQHPQMQPQRHRQIQLPPQYPHQQQPNQHLQQQQPNQHLQQQQQKQHQHQQQLPPQYPQQQQQQQVITAREGPHPLPPVRLAR